MKVKKWLGKMVVVVLSLGMLTGCGNSNVEDNVETENGVEAKKLVIFNPFQTSTSTPENIEIVEKALEEKMAEDGLNIDLDWVVIPRDSFEEKKNTLLAGGEQLDGFVGDLDDLNNDVIKGGLVLPLNDLIEEYGPHLKEMIPEETWAEVTSADGQINAIPSYNRIYWTGAIIRKDWLDDAGLEMPQTLDEFEIVLETFKNRGDGIIPAGGKPWYIEPNMASAVSGGVTAENGWETESPEGEFIQAYEHPDYQEFLKMYNRWLDNGWFDPDFLVTDENNYQNMLCSGKMGVYFTDPTMINTFIPLIQSQDPEAELEVLPVLSGPMGEAALQEISGIKNTVYVSTTSKHPELVVQFFDWLVSDPENYQLAKYGIKDTHYVITDGGKWTAPEQCGGDLTKRGYEDIFAPLDFEQVMLHQEMPYYDTDELQDYYRNLPSYTHPFKDPKGNFIIDYSKVGDYNALDIWTEMYNIACQARPLSDWQLIVDEYEASVKDAYEEVRNQYSDWKIEIGRN